MPPSPAPSDWNYIFMPLRFILELPGNRAERQRALQQKIGSAVEVRVELEDGYALRFPPDGNGRGHRDRP
jgi:hypothetical protein